MRYGPPRLPRYAEQFQRFDTRRRRTVRTLSIMVRRSSWIRARRRLARNGWLVDHSSPDNY